MSKYYPELFIISMFLISVALQVWIVARAGEKKRIYAFIFSIIASVLVVGLIKAPFSSIVAFAVLFLMKDKENESIGKKLFFDFLGVFFGSVGVVFYISIVIFPVGGLYWLWTAIQLKSFSMFLLGVIPFLWIVTSPIGLYSLITDVPDWIYDFFG